MFDTAIWRIGCRIYIDGAAKADGIFKWISSIIIIRVTCMVKQFIREYDQGSNGRGVGGLNPLFNLLTPLF